MQRIRDRQQRSRSTAVRCGKGKRHTENAAAARRRGHCLLISADGYDQCSFSPNALTRPCLTVRLGHASLGTSGCTSRLSPPMLRYGIINRPSQDKQSCGRKHRQLTICFRLAQALRRLTPREEYDRAYRLRVASQLSVLHHPLPKEEQLTAEQVSLLSPPYPGHSFCDQLN